MKNWFGWMVKNPVESAIFIFSLGFGLYFLYFISPFYVAQYASSLSLSIAQRSQEYIFGTFFLATTLPGVVSPFLNSPKWLRWGATLICIDTAFLAVIRIMVYGLVPATWLPLALISLVMVVFSVYLGTKKNS